MSDQLSFIATASKKCIRRFGLPLLVCSVWSCLTVGVFAQPADKELSQRSENSVSAESQGLSTDGAHRVSAEHKVETEQFFRDRVTPFIQNYCLDCHSNKRPTEAGVNFAPALKDPSHAAFTEQWQKAVARVKAHDMPPDDVEQPSDEERQMFVDWLAKIKFLSERDPGPFVLRRLTKTEYGNTLHDLFGVSSTIADALPDEVSGAGYLNSLSPLQLEHYLTIADKVLDEFLTPPDVLPADMPLTDVRRQLFGTPPASAAKGRAAARRVAGSIARKAYRRPPSDEEVEILLQVFDLGRQNDLDYHASLRLMIKSILVSPQFLFITPASKVELTEETVRLDDYQLASRLSYLLWATMPDDELMALANNETLHQPSVLEGQVKRMLLDIRGRALFDGFGAQWLGLNDLQDKVFDTDLFPQMNRELRSAMYDEARLLFNSIVHENRSIVSFIDSDYTFLNETLAKVYRLSEIVSGPEMRRVQLTNSNRGGVLFMPGVLAATSLPNRTSPVKRGVWVLEQVLGDHVPPAPPDVPELDEQDKGSVAKLTLRERTESHRTNPACANCHKTLDPIGFGLENYDAIGRWRELDSNGEEIDASGQLPGGKNFTGPSDLKSIIAHRREELARNLVVRLLSYALCRTLEGYDEIVVDEIMEELASEEYRMQALVSAVVTSYPFTHRRIE